MINVFNQLLSKLSFFYLFTFKKGNDQSTLYDNLIKITLQTNKIPKSKGIYFLNYKLKEFVVDYRDLDTFHKLFYVTPPKKGKSEGLNRSIGNGEVALYWLFKYQDTKNHVDNSHYPSNYDLLIENNNIEIKDFNNPSGKIKYGRFASDKLSLKILSIIFSLYTLFTPINLDELTDKVVNPTNFSGNDLHNIFQIIFSENMESYSDNIIDKIDLMMGYLDNPKSATEATRNFLIKLIKTKLGKKPGDRNFVLNVNESGLVTVFYVDFCKLSLISDIDLFNSVEVSQSSISLNLKKLFG